MYPLVCYGSVDPNGVIVKEYELEGPKRNMCVCVCKNVGRGVVTIHQKLDITIKHNPGFIGLKKLMLAGVQGGNATPPVLKKYCLALSQLDNKEIMNTKV